jgi:hypothetical protein
MAIEENVPEVPTSDEATGQARRGRRGRVALILGVLLVLMAGAVAFVLTRSQGEALALKFTQGRDYRYRMQMKLDGELSSSEGGSAEPFNETVDMTLGMHVASVDQQGVATIDLQPEEGNITVNGERLNFSNPVRSRIRITADGKLFGDSGALTAAGGPSGLSVPGFDQFTPLLPDHAVRPGDTWSKDFDRPFPLGEGVMRFATRNRFLRYETIGGIRTAVVRSDMTFPLDWKLGVRELLEAFGQSTLDLPAGSNPTISYGGQMSLSMTNWFDPQGGEQVKSAARGDVDMRLTFTGFPVEQGVPEGEIRIQGTMTVNLERAP